MPVADTRRLQHFQIEIGALLQPLCFQQLAVADVNSVEPDQVSSALNPLGMPAGCVGRGVT